MGVLTATGLIVGDSLFNVAYAGIVAATDNPDALALVATATWQVPAGLALVAALIAAAYLQMRRSAGA